MQWALTLKEALKSSAEVALERGDAQEALRLYQDASVLDEVVGGRTDSKKRLDLANSRTEVGRAHHAAGDTAEALSTYEEVLDQHRAANDRRAQATTLELMSKAWAAQGEGEKAVRAATDAVQLEAELKDGKGQVRAMANLGEVHLLLGSAKVAEEHYKRALPELRTLGNSELLSKSLVGYGRALSQLDRHDEAIKAYEEAASSSRKRRDAGDEAQALALIGKTYADKGDLLKARERLALAAAAQRAAGSLSGETATYVWLAEVLARSEDVPGASPEARARASAWLLKQACALYEQGELRSVSLQSKADYDLEPLTTYRGAAKLLLEQKRVSEAVELLYSLKEQELRRVRRASGTSLEVADIPFTEAERAVALRWQDALGAFVGARARVNLNPLSQKLRQQESTAAANFQKFLVQLAGNFTAAEAPQSIGNAKNFTAIRNARVLSSDAAAVYTVSFDRELFLIWVTANEYDSKVVSFDGASLPERVRDFFVAVQSPGLDVTAPGKALYDILVAPIQEKLDAAGIRTIAWHLDGPLRYVPLPALWDGDSWLVEQYRTVVINPVSTWFLPQQPAPAWTITALGLSQEHRPFQKLPGVLTELNAIIRDDRTGFGLLEGKKLLDGNFTQAAFELELKERRPVVHIASHYSFGGAAGSTSESFLLLGDGSHLSLDDFEALSSFDLSGVELLVLSACETARAASSTTLASLAGAEVDGLAMVAHRKGAASILATLWRISDASAPSLMTEFYRQRERERERVSKAEALQRAQLAMLRGELSPQTPFGHWKDVCSGSCAADGGIRGVVLVEDLPTTGDWRHPAYWAPFVLIGNWR